MEKQWFETAILTAFLVFTAFAAYQDIKYGSIHVGVFVAGGAVGIFLQTGRLIAAFVRSGICRLEEEWHLQCSSFWALLLLEYFCCVFPV